MLNRKMLEEMSTVVLLEKKQMFSINVHANACIGPRICIVIYFGKILDSRGEICSISDQQDTEGEVIWSCTQRKASLSSRQEAEQGRKHIIGSRRERNPQSLEPEGGPESNMHTCMCMQLIQISPHFVLY